MSPTDHEHEWVQGPGHPDLRCAACGASHSAIQTMLGEAADDAQKMAGERHYTGCRVRQESETLELWLSDAPPQVLQELQAIRPGVYEIHNDAAHPLSELLALQESVDLRALTAQGITAHSFGPGNDGYIWVGVNSDAAAAQAWFEAEYGPGFFRFEVPEPNIVAMVQLECPATGEPIDMFEYRSGMGITADIFSRSIPCPHCGENHVDERASGPGHRGTPARTTRITRARRDHAARLLGDCPSVERRPDFAPVLGTIPERRAKRGASVGVRLDAPDQRERRRRCMRS